MSTMSPVDERGDRTANRVPEIVGASVTLIVLPTVFVFLRLLSRRMAGKDLWVCRLSISVKVMHQKFDRSPSGMTTQQ